MCQLHSGVCFKTTLMKTGHQTFITNSHYVEREMLTLHVIYISRSITTKSIRSKTENYFVRSSWWHCKHIPINFLTIFLSLPIYSPCTGVFWLIFRQKPFSLPRRYHHFISPIFIISHKKQTHPTTNTHWESIPKKITSWGLTNHRKVKMLIVWHAHSHSCT